MKNYGRIIGITIFVYFLITKQWGSVPVERRSKGTAFDYLLWQCIIPSILHIINITTLFYQHLIFVVVTRLGLRVFRFTQKNIRTKGKIRRGRISQRHLYRSNCDAKKKYTKEATIKIQRCLLLKRARLIKPITTSDSNVISLRKKSYKRL